MRTRLFVFAAVFLTAIFPPSALDSPIRAALASKAGYSNSELHYSFKIPKGWVRIPDDAVAETYANIKKKAGTEIHKWAAGFQMANSEHFAYPHIITMHTLIDDAAIYKFNRVFSEDTGEVEEAIKKLESDGRFSNIVISEIEFDDERKMVLFIMTFDVENVGMIKALVALCPGKAGIVQINFRAYDSEFSIYRPVFEEILDSFKFEEKYACSDLRTMLKAAEPNLPYLVGKIILAVVVFSVIGVVTRRVLAARRRKRERLARWGSREKPPDIWSSPQ